MTEETPQDKGVEQATAAVKFEKVEITSDGTKSGTKIMVNGKAVANLSSFNFNFYDSSYCPLSLSYCVKDGESKPGTLETHTNYRLRCPEPAYASRDKAVASAEPTQLVFEFAKASSDQALTDYETAIRTTGKSRWALLK